MRENSATEALSAPVSRETTPRGMVHHSSKDIHKASNNIPILEKEEAVTLRQLGQLNEQLLILRKEKRNKSTSLIFAKGYSPATYNQKKLDEFANRHSDIVYDRRKNRPATPGNSSKKRNSELNTALPGSKHTSKTYLSKGSERVAKIKQATGSVIVRIRPVIHDHNESQEKTRAENKELSIKLERLGNENKQQKEKIAELERELLVEPRNGEEFHIIVENVFSFLHKWNRKNGRKRKRSI